MMYYEPSFIVEKLVVYKGSGIAFQQDFTSGINVIRGENSSGKSTILNFIFYGLGGDFKGWTKEAALCNWVYLYLLVNSKDRLVVRRSVEQKRNQPMEIHFGEIAHDDSGNEVIRPDSWQKFPFSRSPTLPSFSQVIFRAFGFPEVKGDASSNITMHQLLRIIYAEQSNVPQKIFRFEQYDSGLIRDTVGSFLEGVYNDELYNLTINKNEKEKEHEVIHAQLRSFYKLFGASLGDLTKSSIDGQINEWQERIDTLRLEIESIGRGEGDVENGEEEFISLKEEIKVLNKEVEHIYYRISTIEFEQEDSTKFINELESRLSYLNESNEAATILHDISFKHCPACFSPIDSVPEDCCAICGKQEKPNLNSLLRMRNEISMQLKESKKLQLLRRDAKDELYSLLNDKKTRRNTLAEKYDAIVSTWVTNKDLALNQKYSELGYALKAIEDISEKREVSGILIRLQNSKAELSEEISRLSDLISQKEAYNKMQKGKVHKEIIEKLKYLLKADLPRQDSFMEVEEVDFSYEENSVTINGTNYFSASSMVYLNKCFRLAFFWASGKLENMRFPRFLILDGIEDGGMEPERAHNLQRLVKHVSEDVDMEHQIIMATSVIDDSLDDGKYVRGEVYSHENRSLSYVK